MNPDVILPAPDVLPLPAPAILLQALLHLTFLLHLLAMNALLGGLLLTLWTRLRGQDGPQTALADAMAGVTPSLVAATVTLGVAPLLFVQVLYGQFLFTSSILIGWSWFSVVVVLIFAYYGTYLQSYRGAALGGGRLPLLALTVLLFVWVSFVYSNNMSLMLRPEAWGSRYFASAGGWHLNLDDPTLIPRWLHMVLGSVAVAGLMLAWWGRHRTGRGDASGAAMVSTGLGAFIWLTGLNLAAGIWQLLALERPVRLLFMGGSALGTGALTVGLLLGVVLLVMGVRARRRGAQASLGPLSALLLLTLVTMIAMRDVVRAGGLEGLYLPGTFPVQTQGLNLVVFVLLLVGGAVTVGWMGRLLYRNWDR